MIIKYNQINNKDDIEFVINQKMLINDNKLFEDKEFVPRFTLKDIEIFKDLPVNKPLKYSDKLIIKAIKYGLIMLVNYKGDKDNQIMGHERVVYPMCLGKSSKRKGLLRVWHLDGWSVSNNNHTKKIWRLFRTDRILSISFTGSFFRLPPNGYNSEDSGMRGGITIAANFNEIRKNQQSLLQKQVIQDRKDVDLNVNKSGTKGSFSKIKVTNTNTVLDLNEPFDNTVLNGIKDINAMKITFMKTIYGNNYIAVIGAMGNPNNTVKVMGEKNRSVGVFKVLDSTTGDVLKKIKRIKGNTIYDLYIFDKKI